MDVQVCSSDEEALKLVQAFENEDGVRFVTRKSKFFGITRVDSLHQFRILFEDAGRQSVPVLFDGTPFIVLGTDVRECHFGYQRPKTIPDSVRQRFRPSKKMSCTANIKLRRIVKFPDFKIEGQDSRCKRYKITQAIRETFCAVTKQLYQVLVKFDGKHSGHVIGKTMGAKKAKAAVFLRMAAEASESMEVNESSTLRATFATNLDSIAPSIRNNFSRYGGGAQVSTKRQQSKLTLESYWTHRFCLLADPSQDVAPTKEELQLLYKAGLGAKRITFIKNSSPEAFRDKLEEVYPQLRGFGGFELLRSNSESRFDLDLLQMPPCGFSSVHLANESNLGQAVCYIRPIQKDINLFRGIGQPDVIVEADTIKEQCIKCRSMVPLGSLYSHSRTCGNFSDEDLEPTVPKRIKTEPVCQDECFSDEDLEPTVPKQRKTEPVCQDECDLYQSLGKHTEEGIEFLERYATFLKKRCDIETSYATDLKRLVKGFQPKKGEEDENQFSWTRGFRDMLKELHDLAGQHEVIAENTHAQLIPDIQKCVAELKNNRKKFLQESTKLQGQLKDSLISLENAKKNYERKFLEAEQALDSYKRADADINLSRNEVEKTRILSNKRSQESEESKSEYASQLQKTNNFQQDFYTSHMPQVFQHLQGLDAQRFNIVKTVIHESARIEQNVVPIINTCIEGMLKASNSIDPQRDSQVVVERCKSEFPIPGDIAFEDLAHEPQLDNGESTVINTNTNTHIESCAKSSAADEGVEGETIKELCVKCRSMVSVGSLYTHSKTCGNVFTSLFGVAPELVVSHLKPDYSVAMYINPETFSTYLVPSDTSQVDCEPGGNLKDAQIQQIEDRGLFYGSERETFMSLPVTADP